MVAKLLYKPFSIVLGVAAQRVAGRAFEATYERRRGTTPPGATTENATWGQILLPAVIRASTFAVATTAADRAGAKAFRYLFGFWPGEETPAPARRLEARAPTPH